MHAFLCRALIAFGLIAALPAGAAPREEMSLGGQWQVQKVPSLDYPPPEAGWQPCSVPGTLFGANYERAWLRRSFTPPSSMRGRRLELAFGGVKWNSTIYLNGQRVGAYFGGYDAFTLDVTRHIRFDRPNELLVGVHDWTGVFIDRETRLDNLAGRDPRDIPQGKVLAPIGGHVTAYGIWDEVTLRAHPSVYIRDAFIQPSVRHKELRVQAVLANTTPQPQEIRIQGSVLDRGTIALSLPAQTVALAPGGEAAVTLRAPWPNPHLWSHEDPYLYTLTLHAQAGAPLGGLPAGAEDDELSLRFGFREFWTSGPNFYLNGHQVHLLASSWWPPAGSPETPDAIRNWMRRLKKAHVTTFRTHTQPWPEIYYTIADEVGLLMIPEGAVWNDDYAYRVNDPRFWENYATHLRAMVDHLKNHPSVVMWSLENEFFGGRINDTTPARRDLARLGTLMKEWDPTRPIYYESDGDPEGVADVIGLHYPHEYPDFVEWPNEADWLSNPIPAEGFFNQGRKTFLWKRDKPLYIGEFLWVPSSDPSWHTVFFGDDAYRDYAAYRARGKAESWRMQILGYRRHGVGGISPWTVIEHGPLDQTNPCYQAHAWAYRPMAAFPREYDHAFFADERVVRTVDLYNDTLRGGVFQFSWSLVGGPKPMALGSVRLNLPPGAHRVQRLVIPAPHVVRPTPLRLQLTLRRNGQRVFQEHFPFVVHPRPRLTAPDGAGLGLFDPAGQTAPALRRLGLRFRRVAGLNRIDPSVQLLIVGANAFPSPRGARPVPVIGGGTQTVEGIHRFLANGGRVLVLEQQAYPLGLFPNAPGPRRSTMVFPLAHGHPVLRGIAATDLKFWRGDHRVSAGELARPDQGGGRAILVSGSREGLANAPLVEYRVGKGTLLLSQLLLIHKLQREPTAARLLQNCLNYLAAFRPHTGRTGVIADPSFRQVLQRLGLHFDDLSTSLPRANLSRYRLLIAQGSTAPLQAARRQVDAFLAGGGTLLLHCPSPADFAALRPLLGTHLVLQPYAGSVTPGNAADPLQHAFAREDLYWLGKHVGIPWAETPLANHMAESTVAPALQPRTATVYDVRQMRLTGAITEMRPDGAALATAGSVLGQVVVPRPGWYVLGLVARGTPADGVYPLATVSIGSHTLGAVTIASDDWQTHTLFGELPAGKLPLRISFTNDAQTATEDRNLYLQRVLLAPAPTPSQMSLLTNPPALVRLRRGNGSIVIDCIRWHAEETNAAKATRFACSLLSALGATFSDAPGVPVEAEAMDPDPRMPWFQRLGSSVLLAAAGYIQTPVLIKHPGRYRLDLVARGTSAAGVFPLVEVLLDGKPIARVQTSGEAWRAYPFYANLPAGQHELRLAFINDYNIGGEDRNLWLDKLVFRREPPSAPR